ncbi:MAG: hypothetical protein HY007_02780 [Candidatus Sungbacteria bacterium]|nr:hypothetical protein [Candidatus Sungbacteria bacterium]
MKIIVPMAGLGTRFQKVADQNPEYTKPKPLISVRGFPMVRWATGSLPFLEHPGQHVVSPLRVTPKDMIFIVLKEHDKSHAITSELKKIYSNDIHVISLDAVTRGAAETAYQTRPFVDPDEQIIISDSDHFFDGSYLAAMLEHKDPDTAGMIPVFSAPDDRIPRWSYALVKSGSTVIEQVGEKDRALMERGAYANIGAYCFTKAHYFFDAVEEAIAANRTTGDEGKKEFYVAPIYQELISKGMKIQAAITPIVWGLGTPADLEYFLQHCDTKLP